MVEIIMLLVPYITAFIAVISAFWLGRATAPDRYDQGFADGVEAAYAEEGWREHAEAHYAALEETPADMRERARQAFMGEPIKLNY